MSEVFLVASSLLLFVISFQVLGRVPPDAAQMLRCDAIWTDDLRYPLMGRANGDQSEDTLSAADDALMHLNSRFHYLPPSASQRLGSLTQAVGTEGQLRAQLQDGHLALAAVATALELDLVAPRGQFLAGRFGDPLVQERLDQDLLHVRRHGDAGDHLRPEDDGRAADDLLLQVL